jgi:general secretion pathway protein N
MDVIDVSAIGGKEQSGADANTTSVMIAGVAPVEALSDTRERPLFSPSRRPEASSEPVQDQEPPPGLTLIGLMRPTGKDARALIRIDGDGKAVWVRAGDAVGGATVRDIRPGLVLLDRDGRSIELRLRPTRTAAETP